MGLCKDRNGVKKWCKALETKFKGLPVIALKAYKITQYTIKNIRHCKDPMNYIQTMILHACGAKIPKSLYQLALAVYHHIDGLLCQDTQCPCKKTTVKDIIAKICKLWNVWFDTYTRCQANIALFQHHQPDQQVQVTGSVQLGTVKCVQCFTSIWTSQQHVSFLAK